MQILLRFSWRELEFLQVFAARLFISNAFVFTRIIGKAVRSEPHQRPCRWRRVKQPKT